MSQPYIDVTEFIEHPDKLYYDGTYYYDNDLYGILQPLSPKYDIQFFGDYLEFNANSPFPIHSLVTTPEDGIHSVGLINDTLVILDNNGKCSFKRISVSSKGEYIDNTYINSQFSTDIINGTFNDIAFEPNNGDGAIFIKDNQEIIFHNIPTPTDIDTLINGRLVSDAAVNTQKHFCLVFDTGEVLYYNGFDLSDTSYEMIPNDIITNQDYSSFTVGDFRSPNELSTISNVVAHNGFAVLTFDGNVIVWGDDFQRINNNDSSVIKPTATFDVTALSGCGVDYGVGVREDGTAVTWGTEMDNRLSNILTISDIKHIIPLREGLFYTTNNGKELNYSNDNFPVNDSTFTDFTNYYTENELLDVQYVKDLVYSDRFMFTIIEHSNPNNDPIKLDFKLRLYNDRYYIPLLHFMDYEPANVNLEVYTVCKSEYNTIGRNIEFSVVDTYYNENGIADFSKIVITPIDKDRNGVPDEPLSYKLIVDENDFIILESFIDINDSEVTRVSNTTHKLSESSYIEPNAIYYADVDETIVDFEDNHINYEQGKFYKGDVLIDGVMPNSASLLADNYDPVSGRTYYIKHGRSFTKDDPFKFQWTHYSSDGADRIDPSVSTIMDMYVLTNAYDNAVRRWLRSGASIEQFPEAPTSEEIRNSIRFIERNKSTSDQVIYIPAEYKLLFGSTARPEHQAEFKIVKMSGATLTDNEIKSQTIDAINQYFNIDNWDFGESFYFTELAAHIHNQLSGHVASVVVVPKFQSSTFGDLFQIKCEPNELFLSTAGVNDIIITNQYTNQNLRKFR